MLGGEGEVTAGGDTAELRKDVAVLMPAGLEVRIEVPPDTHPLTCCTFINEPTPGRLPSQDKNGA